MKIRAFRVPSVGTEQERVPTLLEQRLLQSQGDFDHDIATALAFLSSWAYGEPEEFAASLLRIGLPGSQCASLDLSNDALLLTDRAYLVQSSDKQ
jgi:hypothetical protein